MRADAWSLVAAALCTLSLMPLVIRARTLGYASGESAQHVHARPSSRLGGSALFLAYALGVGVAVLLDSVPPQAILALLA